MYGVFEDGDLITGAFTDLGSAEDHKDELIRDHTMVYGNLEALELCPDHESHAYGGCEEHFAKTCPTEVDLLERILHGLAKKL